ncbi:MAG: hypothetical protein SOU03_01325 [Dorea sp.]|nr:hypothetical protein [Dorea sp.]
MKQRKKLKELTLKDNFLFGAVMMEEENPKELVKFLHFVKADLNESETDFGDDYVAMHAIKRSSGPF